jgi:hypothetical protein
MSGGAMVPVIHAAAAAARRRQLEEEEMATYSKEDLDGWEFKIMRSEMGRFRNYERVRELCQEEGKAGWEMVEKFDDNRIRFKRRVEHRSSDAHLGTDPYRTRVGVAAAGVAGIVLAVLAALVAATLLLTNVWTRRPGGTGEAPILVFLAIVAIAGVVLVVANRRR